MSHPEPSTFQAWPFFRLFLDGAAASALAESVTMPFEVTKMRLQLQRSDKQQPQQTRYTGMVHTFRTIVKEEKWFSLFKGLEAGVHKQILYTGFRLGLYDWLTGFSGDEEVSMPYKIACASMTTGIGIMLANPSDVVQTRFIAYRSTGLLPGSGTSSNGAVPGAVSRPPTSDMAVKSGTQQSRQYSSFSAVRPLHSGHRYMSSVVVNPLQHQQATGGLRHDLRHLSCLRSVGGSQSLCSTQLRGGSHSACGVNAQSSTAGGPKSVTGVPLSSASRAYGVILREEGLVNGLYRGIAANLICSCVQGAAEIVTYDFTKEAAIKRGYEDSMPLHLAAGMAAGLVATVVSNPLDVVATRMMVVKTQVKKGTLGTILDIWRREGIGAFYSGFGPNILRIGSFNIVLWLSYEQIRKI